MMQPKDYMFLELTSAELWAVYLFVHKSSDDPNYGAAWSQSFQLQLFNLIRTADEHPDEPSLTYVLILDETLAWLITQQVDPNYMVGLNFVGVSVIKKAMDYLIKQNHIGESEGPLAPLVFTFRSPPEPDEGGVYAAAS